LVQIRQEGSSISRQNLNENLEPLHLAPKLFYHLPGFYLKTGYLNPHPLSLLIMNEGAETKIHKFLDGTEKYDF
jgi:hypothetical protein